MAYRMPKPRIPKPLIPNPRMPKPLPEVVFMFMGGL